MRGGGDEERGEWGGWGSGVWVGVGGYFWIKGSSFFLYNEFIGNG